MLYEPTRFDALIDEPWVLAGPTSWNRPLSEKIFEAAGLSRPNPRIATSSIILRARLIAGSPYLGMFLNSVLRRLIADHHAIMALPVDLHQNVSTGIVTLKNRTLSPVVERFLACVREALRHRLPTSQEAERRGCRSLTSLKDSPVMK